MTYETSRKAIRRAGSLILLTGLLLAFAGCESSVKIASTWSNGEISIDGLKDDWRGEWTHFEEERISISIQNDRQAIYLVLVTDEPVLRRQLAMQGLRFWFHNEGSDKRSRGVRYPVGMAEILRETGAPPPKPYGDPFADESFREAFDESLTELDILGPDKDDTIRIRLADLNDAAMYAGNQNESFVYEMKIPLHAPEGTVGFEGSDGKLRIGLETVPLDLEKMRAGRGEGGRGGGRPGRGFERPGGGGRAGGGKRAGGGGRGLPEPFELWIDVTLATEQTTENSPELTGKGD